MSYSKAISQTVPSHPVYVNESGYLVYTPDSMGNRIPDFSYCGYKASDKSIPFVHPAVIVPLTEGDATEKIQWALDYVASLPENKNGFRGAVLLEKGTYIISGSLAINATGVVLRGSGMDEEGTLLLGDGVTRETLIRITGKNDRIVAKPVKIADEYVPVNAMQFHVAKEHSFQPGDRVMVHRPSTSEWIKNTGMNDFGPENGWLTWNPGERDIYWDRQIISVDANLITIDAPVTMTLDNNFGGGYVAEYQWPGRISNVGIENLRSRSYFDVQNPKDEDHRWMAITIENAMDVWIRQVVFEHFAGSAVAVYSSAKQVTVEDCKSLAPVSEIAGHRRHTFFTEGQQTLFQRLYSEYGYHDFSAGFCAAGPNAFVQCEAYLPYNFSGAIDSWVTGLLFDNVNIIGNKLAFKNIGIDRKGAGWNAANSLFWQCSASRIECHDPPTANNWAFGCWGQFAGNGYWAHSNSHILPRSLFYAQLAERLGKNVADMANFLPIETSSTSSPTTEQAAMLTRQSRKPAPTLLEWIDKAPERNPISVSSRKVKTIDQLGFKVTDNIKGANEKVTIENGWLVFDGKVLTGNTMGVQWWRGDTRSYGIEKSTPHVTRFVPGREGHGLTDNLEELTRNMVVDNIVALEHNYGLWYDRRRDDHQRVRRMDGDVWAPFYELPFARSGEGTAWDGLSKYDLTRFNPWYWSRLQKFAGLAEAEGRILINQNYFQHNILEAGAHWADFPWRIANNINNTGLPEPPPYAGDKRIFMAEQFYDINHPVRSELHRLYIRKCLENFVDNSNVIQFAGAEYTGPLHFVQFWMDVIGDWKKETGKNALVGLSATKDVQDAILADKKYLHSVDLIDIRYWWYQKNEELYAPEGGKNLAPRQHARLLRPEKPSFEQVYLAVNEYREGYPDKVIIYSAEGAAEYGWAVFMAGGSLANIPKIEHPGFLSDAGFMKPVVAKNKDSKQWVLGNPERGYIVFNNSEEALRLDLTNVQGNFLIQWINPENGKIIGKGEHCRGGMILIRNKPVAGAIVAWITRI